MNDQDELAPAMHGDPTSDNREDPYFRQTSPVKTYQTRTPRKSAGGGSISAAASAYGGGASHQTGRSMAHSHSHVQISTTNVDAAPYGELNGGRDSPLRRNSPKRCSYSPAATRSARGSHHSPAQQRSTSSMLNYQVQQTRHQASSSS